MSYVVLKHVDGGSQNWQILVRAIRFCEFISNEDPPARQRIDMVLIDEEGTSIEAQVPESWHKRSATPLLENHVYMIKYFHVMQRKASYRAVEHQSMVKFTQYTKISEVTSNLDRFPLYAHAAVSFDVLATRINHDEILSDTFGVLTACSRVKQQRTKAGVKEMRNVRISNGSDEITLSLWGRHATMFDADRFVEQSQRDMVVFLFCGLTCRMYNGRLTPQGSYLCRWYVNPDVPEAAHLRHSFADPVGPAVWLDGDAPAVQYEEATVPELGTYNPHEIDHKRFVVKAKIKSVHTKQSWWYMACTTCNKKIIGQGGVYRCGNSGCGNSGAVPRYCLPVQVVDPAVSLTAEDTPSVHFILFGPTAEEVIGAPVHEVMKDTIETGSNFPARINSICGKSFAMRVSVSRASYNDEQPISYQVNNIIGPVADENDAVVISADEDVVPETSDAAATIKKGEAEEVVPGPADNSASREEHGKDMLSAGAPTVLPEQAVSTPARATQQSPKAHVLMPHTPAMAEGTKSLAAARKRSVTEDDKVSSGQSEGPASKSAAAKRKLRFDAAPRST